MKVSGLSAKQIEILKFGHSDYDALICDGAVRSGKTSVLAIAFILWAMNKFTNQNFIIASKSVTSAKRNIIKPLLAVIYLQKQFDIVYYTSSSILKVTRGNNTNYFYVFGGRDEASYQTVQGVTAAGAFLDEVVLMPQSFVNQVLARCSVENSKYWFSSNPDGPEHWFYKEWIQKLENKNAQYLHFVMDDNPSLSEKIKARYKRMYDGVFFQRYILGLWVRAEGIIYTRYASNEEDFLLDEVPDDIIFINAGVDFGGTKSAHTFVATGFTSMMRNVVVLEAERHEEEVSPDELDMLFVQFCVMVYDKYHKPFNARCDNAEPVLIRGLKNASIKHGLHTKVKNALKTSIKGRIDLVIKLLGQKRFFLMRETTKPVQKGLRNAVWSKKKPNTRLDDGVTSDIDIMDALEYSIEEYRNNLLDRE